MAKAHPFDSPGRNGPENVVPQPAGPGKGGTPFPRRDDRACQTWIPPSQGGTLWVNPVAPGDAPG